MQVIGILGGIASGKSLVAEHLGRLGAAVIDADRLGHAVLREPEVELAARERWGAAIFGLGGHIDRSKLAKIVFAPTAAGRAELVYLEKLTHPRIAERIGRQIDEVVERRVARAVVLDAPVLVKAGWNKFCNHIIYVDSPREIRVGRALARGWNQEEFARREAAQDSLDAQRELADLVIDNSGCVELTAAQIEQFWHSLFGPVPPL